MACQMVPAVFDTVAVDLRPGGDGGVQIWDLPGASDNCLQWPTGRGGLLRQGHSDL